MTSVHAQELRKLGHYAVTEGVSLKYVDRARQALYSAADRIERLEEAVRQGHVFVTDALDELYDNETDAVDSDGTVGVRLISARDVLAEASRNV